jgi:photosystem II stability/assembly factor-like uncharacterized protein
MEERFRRRLHDAFDRPDFPSRDLVWRAMERIDDEPDHSHRREWAVALAALLLAAAVLATFAVVSQRLIPKPQPAHTTQPTTEAGAAYPPNESGKRLYFVSPEVGWTFRVQTGMGSMPATLSKTTDGGKTWQEQLNWKGGDPVYARFDDAKTGVFIVHVQPAAVVWRTTDGVTWTPSPPAPIDPTAAYFINSREGWIRGVASQRNVPIYHTTDGGQTWKQVSGFTAANDSGGLYFADSSTGYATSFAQGAMPPVYVTHDGGATWTAVQMPAPPALTSSASVSVHYVQALPGDKAFAVVNIYTANKSQIYLIPTTDGGRTWAQPLPLPDSSGGGALQVVDADHMYLAGAELWKSADGGRSWTKVAAKLPPAPPSYRNPGNHFNGILFVNSNVGWAFLAQQEQCAGQKELGAADATWPPCGSRPAAVRFIAIKTTDGGQTWTEMAPLS